MGKVRKVVGDRWLPSGEALDEGSEDKGILIWRGIPGERARVRVEHNGRNRIFTTWLSGHPPDPHRVEPGCERVDPCGGCPIMHVDAEGQAAARRALVARALASEGVSDIEVGTHHPCPDGLSEYRYVAKLGIGYSERGRIKVGAWGRGNRKVVPIPDCPAVAPSVRKTMKSLAHHIITEEIAPYDAETGRGVLRAVVVRASRTTGDVVVTLVAGRRNHKLEELAELVSQGVSEVTGVWLHLNSDAGNAIYSRDAFGAVRVRHLRGRDILEETIGEVTYRIGPGDFFQTNPSVAAKLYDRVVELLDPQSTDAFIDLYCGVGGVALQVASRCGFVVGVESVEGAVFRARAAARQNRLTAEFLARDVLEVLPELEKRLAGTRPLVCVNPSRRGLEPGVAEALLALEPRRVVYISCNPKSLARDLAALTEGGLEAGPVDMFDMFPNTAHVECVVALEGRGSGGRSRRAPRRKVVRPS